MKKQKKIFVDMSATIIHHGHIRILKKASKYGQVIVGLTKDKDLIKYKMINPEIKFINRAEILESVKYVKKVIPSNFIISDKFLYKNNIDLVVNGGDYKKRKFKIRSICFNRTKNISSSKIRKLVVKNYEKNKK
tara:strand:- start:4319 stop:4720 length:402 start_codon:yes stop_codon:yes gene_type:complete